MNKLIQATLVTANLFMFILVIFFGLYWIKNFNTNLAILDKPQSSNKSIPPQSVVGTKIQLPDFDWSKQSKSLVLVLQKGCHFCSESTPFYKRLQELTKDKNIKLVAVLPSNPSTSLDYLKEQGISDLEVKQSQLNSLQVKGTPTLFLVNDLGEITNYWIGKLDSERESEVIENLLQ